MSRSSLAGAIMPVIIGLLFACALLPETAGAQGVEASQQNQGRIERILKEMSSPSWLQRSAAFRMLSRRDMDDERVRVGLFNLLKTEKNDDGSWTTSTKSDAESEALIEYLHDLLEAVVSLDDPRSIPYLVRYIHSGMMIWSYLIKNSSVSLPLVVDRLYHGSPGQQHGAAMIMGLMLSMEFGSHVSREQKEAIDREISGILDDPDRSAFKALALVALSNSGDIAYRPVIAKLLSDSDPKIRAAAKDALERLSRKP